MFRYKNNKGEWKELVEADSLSGLKIWKGYKSEYERMTSHYDDVLYIVKEDIPLFFTAREAGATICLGSQGDAPDVVLEKSFDLTTWTPFEIGEEVILNNEGDRVYFRGDNETFSYTQDIYDKNDYVQFFAYDGYVDIGGNIMSLLDKTMRQDYVPDFGFIGLFANNWTIINADILLPAITLGEGCYASMFEADSSLERAPSVLPATVLSDYCYDRMFSNCGSLTKAPELPATALAAGCYKEMFSSTSLAIAPELPATVLADECYLEMFSYCDSLTIAPQLPATTLATSCYEGMFCGCTSLTTPPVLPATTLATWCYSGMFSGCTSLTTALELPATTLAENCYYYMFYGCTSLTTPPELPATTLAENCYYYMFQGCTNIKLSETQTAPYSIPYRIPSEGTGTVGASSLTDMFYNTGGTFTGTPTINTTYYLSTNN